jgi:hypothetical protein
MRNLAMFAWQIRARISDLIEWNSIFIKIQNKSNLFDQEKLIEEGICDAEGPSVSSINRIIRNLAVAGYPISQPAVANQNVWPFH